MNDDINERISRISSLSEKAAFRELEAAITDWSELSAAQMHYLIEQCKKAIAFMESNPSEARGYYDCSIIGATEPKDFLIESLCLLEEAYEPREPLTDIFRMEPEDREWLEKVAQIIKATLGIAAPYKHPAPRVIIIDRSYKKYELRTGTSFSSRSKNADLLREIGDNLVHIGNFVRWEPLYRDLNALASVIYELQAEYRHLSKFIDWLEHYIDSNYWYEKEHEYFSFLPKDILTDESDCIEFSNKLEECGGVIHRISYKVLGEKFLRDESAITETVVPLREYLGGLESAVRRLRLQLEESPEPPIQEEDL